MFTIFDQKIEFGAVQKYVNLVDLEKCCKMSIYLQNLASIQPRTSLSKFGGCTSVDATSVDATERVAVTVAFLGSALGLALLEDRVI